MVKDYNFMVDITAAIHVDAASREEAVQLIKDNGERFSAEITLGAGRLLRLTEITLSDSLNLLEVDGEEPEPEPEPAPVEVLAKVDTEPWTPSDSERLFVGRVKRLKKLHELDAPPLILHRERCLVAHALGLLVGVSDPDSYELPSHNEFHVVPVDITNSKYIETLQTALQYLRCADFSGDPDWPGLVDNADAALVHLNKENQLLKHWTNRSKEA